MGFNFCIALWDTRVPLGRRRELDSTLGLGGGSSIAAACCPETNAGNNQGVD